MIVIIIIIIILLSFFLCKTHKMLKLVLEKQSFLTQSGYLTETTFTLNDGDSLYINSTGNNIFITRNGIKSEEESELNIALKKTNSLAGNHGCFYYKHGVMYYKQLFNTHTNSYLNSDNTHFIKPGEQIVLNCLTDYLYLADSEFRFNFRKVKTTINE